MSGLKLQYLSNPSGSAPSFIFGNPQKAPKRRKKTKKKGLAKSSKSRENSSNQRMVRVAKRRRNKASKQVHHKKRRASKRTKKNPHVTYGTKGTRAKRIGSSKTREERLEAVKAALAHRARMRGPVAEKLKAKYPEAYEHAKKSLRKRQRSIHKESGRRHAHYKKAAKYRKKGYLVSVADESPKRAALMERREKIAMRKEKARRKAAARKRKAKHKKRAKKAHHTRKRNKSKAKARARKAAATRRRNKRKQSVKKNPYKRSRSKKHALRRSVGKHKKHRKSRKAKRPSFLKNPFGGAGSMGDKIVDFLTGGDKKLATSLFVAPAVAGLVQDAISYAWPGFAGVIASIEGTLNGINPQLGGLLSPIMPNLVLAVAAEAAGQHFKKPLVQRMGAALMFANIIDVSEAVGALVSTALIPSTTVPASAAATPAQLVTGAPAATVSGVDFTMRGIPRGLHGVDYTMGHRGMRGIPKGFRAMPSMRGVDFSSTPGFNGLTPRDRGDFGRQFADFGQGTSDAFHSAGGTLKTNADFGRHGQGAMPAMRGAHTGDVMYPDPTVDADGNEIDTDESDDHMM